jgi:4-hydroxyphenylpyruvate dioxygenase
VTLYRQGEINFIMNAEPDSALPSALRKLHGPSICAIAFRVDRTPRQPTSAR